MPFPRYSVLLAGTCDLAIILPLSFLFLFQGYIFPVESPILRLLRCLGLIRFAASMKTYSASDPVGLMRGCGSPLPGLCRDLLGLLFYPSTCRELILQGREVLGRASALQTWPWEPWSPCLCSKDQTVAELLARAE